MKSTNEVLQHISQYFEDWQVLTDIEDKYVYSFEKIYNKTAYSLPDIVVRIDQSDNSIKFLEWTKDQNLNLISRKTRDYNDQSDLEKISILLDDIERLEIDTISDEPKNLRHSLGYKMSRNAFSIYKNLASAVQLMLSEKKFSKCLQHDACGGYCTITPFYKGIETWSAKGRFFLIRGLMRGDLEYSKKVIDIIFTCSKCGNCFSECFQSSDFHKAITRMRQIIAEKELVPQVFQIAANNILTTGDPGASSVDRRLSWLKGVSNRKLPEKAENLFWVGCMVSTRTPQTAISLYNILNHVKSDFTLLGGKEGCCGYVLLSAGLHKESEIVADEVIKKIEETNAKFLITPCSGCYYTFTKLYPMILDVSLPCEILHSTQFIEKKISQGVLKFQAYNESVAFHDPCSLGRHCRVYDAPRNVLKAIPDLNLVEMPFNREITRCCGGGGGLWSFNHRVSMDSAFTRLKEDWNPTNTNILATACPQCQMNFNITSRRKKIPAKIRDIVEIVEETIILE
ncbi:MAG: (Fe-S)-binding protein [Candidatus Hodarchaeales archaeon]|jgi:Fe-S oxidoreductase